MEVEIALFEKMGLYKKLYYFRFEGKMDEG